MSTSILLITDNPGQPWNRLLDETISSIGLLVEAGEQTAMRLLIQQTYDLVLIDGSVGSKLALLVARVRALRPESTIVVATADPEWMSAREVLQAGAVDYISKSFDKQEVLSAINAALRLGAKVNRHR